MLAFINLIRLEILNYITYKKAVNVSNKKFHHDHIHNVDWMENFWLYELNKDELITWIEKSINNKNIVNYKVIPRSKMLKWVAYNLYYKSDLNVSEMIHANKVLLKIEHKINYVFQENIVDDFHVMKYGNTKINAVYKPLFLYFIFNSVKHITYNILKINGFKKYSECGITYFYYKNNNHKNTTIFIHGLGFGLTPYISFLLALKNHTNVIAIVLPNLSNMYYHNNINTNDDLFPSFSVWQIMFNNILIKHNLDKINVIGHSFGTIILSILLKNNTISNKIKRRIFIDPVCFIDQCYKINRYINDPDNNTFMNRIFNMLIYNDIYVRYVTLRWMHGPEFWIFDYDSMGNKNNLVILSKQDAVVPSDVLLERFNKHDIPCIMVHGASHADIFLVDIYKDVLNSVHHFTLRSYTVDEQLHLLT